jgi:hypothetical protein
VINSVKDDLQTEQGQLLLRVLSTLTAVQGDAIKKREERQRSKSRDQQAAPLPAQADEERKEPQRPQQSREEREQQMLNQAYQVRFQTCITSPDYQKGDDQVKKQLLGTLIYDHVKYFLDGAISTGLVQGHQIDYTPKVTGMIMSLPVQHLTIGISTYQGLFNKVNEALALLVRNRQPTQQ